IFLLLPPLLLMALGIALSVSVFEPRATQILSMLLVVAIFLYPMIGLLLWPFYKAASQRVAMAPEWLMGLVISGAVLALERKRELDVKRPGSTLKLVVFAGECSICKGRVSIGPGGLRFWGRLVGRCEDSPREHVFSFD